MQMKLGRKSVLCLLLTLLPITYTQDPVIGNSRPCGPDNLSCPVMNPSDWLSRCYNSSQLCDGVDDCLGGSDEGVTVPNLDCGGVDSGRGNDTYICMGLPITHLDLDALCDGNRDCNNGDDETTALCENKCLLPYYGGCSFTRQCNSFDLGANCGDCLPGYIEAQPVQIDCIMPLAEFAFIELSSNVNESDGQVSVIVQLVIFGVVSAPEFAVIIQTSPLDAEADLDYGNTSVTLRFPIGSRSVSTMSAVIPIINDGLVERPEMFAVLGSTTDPQAQFRPGEDRVDITILDDDVATFAFTELDYSADEGIGSIAPIIEFRNGILDVDFEITIQTSPGTATADEDYASALVTVTFSAGASSLSRQTAVILIVDDLLVERTENFTVTLSSNEAQARFVPGMDSATLFIMDSDVAVFAFIQSSYDVRESDGQLNVTVQLINGSLTFDIVVIVTSSPVTATAGVDYNATTESLTFSAGALPGATQSTVLTVIDDALEEFPETIIFSAALTDPQTMFSPGGQQTTINILDDDGPAQIVFTMANPTVAENVGSVVVEVVLMGQIDRNISVTVEASAGTATRDADFNTLSVTLTFSEGPFSQSHSVNVEVINDNTCEDDENFRLFLTTTNLRPDILLGEDALVTINDDDICTIGLVPPSGITIPSYTVQETSTNPIIIICTELLTGQLDQSETVSFNFDTEPQTAIYPDDFIRTSVVLSFNALNQNQLLCTPISITDDALCEESETFLVSLTSSDSRFVLDPSQGTVLIENNDAAGNCTISDQLSQIRDRLMNEPLTGGNFNEIIGDLARLISLADVLVTEQTSDNLRVVILVFINIVDGPSFIVNVQTVTTAVAIVDDLQGWPEAVIAEGGPEIIWSLERALINLVRQDDFTILRFFGDNITLIAERVELQDLQSNGRASFVSRSHGTLRPTTGPVNIFDEDLTSEEIGLALLPASLFETFTEEEIGMFFLLYENASPFPVAGRTGSRIIGSPVVSATVVTSEQTSFRNLRDPVTIVVRLNPVQDGNISNPTCVSWNFSLADGRGDWTPEGCTTMEGDDPDVVVCECDHLTNFAVLVDICTRRDGCRPLPPEAELALDIISIIGIVLSMLGLILTIITLLAIKKLRQQEATKFHIQLCIAIFCMLLVFVIGIDRVPPDDPYGGCVAVSALIQYFTLVAVMWMGAEALLMFEKLVIVHIRIATKYIIAASIICWTLPIVAVAVPLAVDRDFMLTFDDTNSDVVEFCFIGDIRVFYGAFLGPIGAILIFNFAIFVMVAYVAIRHRKRDSTKGASKKGTFALILRLIGVTCLFGLTWVFGALTIRSETSLAFQILFAVFNSFQGFFLFLFFCVLNNEARKSWKRLLLCRHRSSPPVSRIKISNPYPPSGATRSTAEGSQSHPSRNSNLRLSAAEGSDQIDIGPGIAEIHFTEDVVESPVTVIPPREGTELNGITIIENHHADHRNGRPRSHAQLARIGDRERRATHGPPGQLLHTDTQGFVV